MSEKIIIIDPHPEHCDNLQEMLLLKDIESVVVANEAEGLSLLQNERGVSKIILDPRKGAWSIDVIDTPLLRKTGIPIILHTTATKDELREAGFPQHTWYIQKPLCPFGIAENLN